MSRRRMGHEEEGRKGRRKEEEEMGRGMMGKRED